jgi:choline monooxygenase
VVVVRGGEGTLRAFVNVCRHRGSIVVDGEGRRETIQCPYHAWTYDLDGSLRRAPRAEREPEFSAEGLGLVAVAVESWGPFVFVNPAPDPAPLADHLGDVPAQLAAGGIDLGSIEFHHRVETEYEANWKVCVENYLECYHCAVAHPAFARVIDVSPDAYGLEVGRWSASQIGVPRVDALEVAHGQFHLLFPNTAINVMPGAANLSIGPIVPLAPERTYRSLDYFFGPEVDEAWIGDYLDLDDQVGGEDRALVERVQAGVRSGALAHGYPLPRSEQLVLHFDRLLVEALGR